jgi:hypothetical protein
MEDKHHSHLGSSMLDVAKHLGIQLFCLPAHCSDELQPLDDSFFKPLKSYWNEAIVNYCKQHPRRLLGKLQFPKLNTHVRMYPATPNNAVSGFRSTGI